MNFIFEALFGKKSSKGKNNGQENEKLNSATANNVLKFLTFGLTYGAASLRDRYQPATKIDEFVAVSGQILTALKRHHDAGLRSSSVVLSLHINALPKQITMTEVGPNVMLALEESSTLITQTTLNELYLNMRNDVIAHGDIYGADLLKMARTYTELE
jgi:hypothetical protein